MVFPGIFGTHFIYQQTHSPFTDVSINKDFFEKIFLIKVSCCWFTCEKFAFNVSLPITLCNSPTHYSTQYLTYIISFDAQYFPYSNTMFNDCKICCSSNRRLFWWSQFCCNLLRSCSVFFYSSRLMFSLTTSTFLSKTTYSIYFCIPLRLFCRELWLLRKEWQIDIFSK